MLLFNTLLNITGSMTRDDFIALVFEWNQTSEYRENIIENLEYHGEKEIRYGDENLSLEIQTLNCPDITAVRYSKKTEDGVVWTTDYVMNFSERKMAVRLDRSYREEALMLYSPFSTPHFITLLIQKGYLQDDHGLPVSRVPHIIDEGSLSILRDVVTGNSPYDLPVVYVSRTYYDEDPVDVRRMAGRLKGIAHVLSEKSVFLDPQIRTVCDSRNEYHGAIGVYYPNEAMGPRRFLYHGESGADSALMEKVIRNVMEYANSQLLDPLYTWHGVNNAVLAAMVENQMEENRKAQQARQEAEDEMGQVYDIFDRDLEKLRSQVEELIRINQAQEAEIIGLRASLSANEQKPLLLMGEEEDFFAGEILEILSDALKESVKNEKEGSRRAIVLNDVIEHNGSPARLAEMKEELKKAFKGYKTMSSVLRQQLINMGFTISEEGKHYKLIYRNDPRFCTVIAKTGSDHREGMNIAAKIIREML